MSYCASHFNSTSTEDHQWLRTKISKAAVKWRALGRELGFTHDELGAVVALPGLHEVKDYMDELLSRWLKRAPPKHVWKTLPPHCVQLGRTEQLITLKS